MQHELPALGLGDRYGDADLAAQLVGCAGLALADALDLGGVQRVDLRPTLALVLEEHPQGQRKQRREDLLQAIVAGDLAADVAHYPAEAGAQELQLAA